MKSGSYLLYRIRINHQLKQQSVANKWKTSSQYAPLFLHSRKLRMCYFSSSSSSDSRQGHDDDSSTEIRYLENSSIKVSRSQSGMNSTSKTRRFIPPPTWSIKELNLSGIADDDESNRDLDKNEELLMNMNRLSQLSLIDISSLSQERQNKIERNLKSIMQCLNVLNNDNDAIVVDQQAKSPLSDKEIYDSPRGLSCMPLYWNSDNNVEKEDSYFESTRDNLLESVSHRLVSSYDDREKGEEENHKNDKIRDSENRANKYNESIGNEKFFTVVTRTRSER